MELMMMSSSSAAAATSPQQLPPGFRFHPTDEELILHYLRNRAASMPCPVDIIADVDIYKFDPWDLPCKAVYGDGEWYFFSPRDRKYPNGIRPNRAAGSGYWKATGTDKPVRDTCTGESVGVKKALVFYKGRPPRGTKTDWIMHEYRLAAAAGDQLAGLRRPPVKSRNVSMRLDDWVLCRIYQKSGQAALPTTMVPPLADYDRLIMDDDDHDERLAAARFDDDIYSSSFVYAPTSCSDGGTTCSVNNTQQQSALPKIPSISDLIVDDYTIAQILDTAVPPDDVDLLHAAPFAMHSSLNQLLTVGGDTGAHSSEESELNIYSPAYYCPAAGGGAVGVAKRKASHPHVNNECVAGDGGAGNIFSSPPPPAKRFRAASCFDAQPPASGLLLPPPTMPSQVLSGLNHNSMLQLPQL